MGMSQDQYIAQAQSQHVETLSFVQEADPTKQRLFSNEPSKNETVIMLNYRVAKMVNLMSWAYTRALMTEFRAHMYYEEMMNSDIVLKSKIEEVERRHPEELGGVQHRKKVQEHVNARSSESGE